LTSLLLVLFSLGWAAIAFAAVRALVQLWGYERRVAIASAVAVAAAFFLGSASPFALSKRLSAPAAAPAAAPVAAAPAPPPAPAVSPASISCIAHVAVDAKPAVGHTDAVSVSGAGVNPATPIAVPAGAPIAVGGWIVADNGLAQHICVLVDGRPAAFNGHYGISRPDVAAALNTPADTLSGFDIRLHLSGGKHVVAAGVVDADGKVALLAPMTFDVQTR
jgi:hypothetical protein